MRIRTGLGIVAATVVMVGGAVVPVAAQEDDGTRIAVVVHGEPSSRFWAVVKAGAEKAAEDLGVTVDYYADVIWWERPAGGVVFDLGSIAATGALAADPGVQALVRNVLARFGVRRETRG